MPVDFAQSSRVLSMLPKIDPEDAKMFVEAAVALLPDSPMAQHLVHYQHALAYYERHHAWPDLPYLREEFKKTLKEGVESDPELDYEHDGEVSPCLITDFLRMIEEDAARHAILMAMGEGDFTTVAERAQSLGTVKKPVAYSVDDALAAYKKRQDHGGTGVRCGVDRIDEVVNGFPYGTMTVVAAPPSMGKCVVGETRIHTDLGYLPIREIPHGVSDPDGFSDLARTVRGGHTATKFYEGGVQDTIRVSGTNFTVEGTATHRVRVLGPEGVEWRRLDEMRTGDWVCLDAGQPLLFHRSVARPSVFEHLEDEDYGYVLGYWLGDGSTGNQHERNGGNPQCLSFHGATEGISVIRSLVDPEGYWKLYEKNPGNFTLRLNSKEKTAEAQAFGFAGGSHDKRIPEWVFRSNREVIVGVLSGLIDSDGHVQDGAHLEIGSVCRGLLEDAQALFNLLGVFPKVRPVKAGGPDGSYRLVVDIGEAGDLGQLNLRIGVKRQRLAKLVAYARTSERGGGDIPYAPFVVRGLKEALRRRLPKATRADRALYKNEFSLVERASRRRLFRRNTLRRFVRSFPLPEGFGLEALEAYKFSRVTTVAHGRAEVFDLTVPATEAFTANGLVNHNSTFAVNTAYHCIKRGFKVCFVTLEVPKENLTYNFIARHAAHRGERDLTAEPMHKGKLTQEQGEVFERMAAELKPLMEKNLFILDASDFPKFDRAYLNKLWDQIDEALGGLDVIVLDYVNMCRYFRPPKVEINAYVNDIITYFAILSRTFKKGRGLIVFLLAQVNREGQRRLDYKDGEKGADQTILAEFNSLERDAHFIIVLYTSLAMRVAGQVKVQVIKNRTGPVHDQMQPVNANFGQFWFDAGTVKEIFGLDEYSNRWKGTDPAPSARADEAALAEEVEMALDNADQRYEEPVE